MSAKFLKVITNENSTPEILVHGPIGKSMWSDEGVTGEEFTNELNKFPKGTKVVVGVNSQGGSVGEGLAIYNAIGRRAEDVTVRVDGYALSIASVFPQAAGRIISPKTSIWMMHKASMWSQGNADQLRKDADLLDTHDDVISKIYMKATGKTKKEIRACMDEETWFTGDEAVEFGLASESNEGPTNFEPIDLTKFKNVPDTVQNILAAARTPDTPPSPIVTKPETPPAASLSAPANSGAATTTKQQQNMDKNATIAALRKRGDTVADDATEDQLLALISKPASTPLTSATAASDNNSIIINFQAQLREERRKRVQAEVLKRGENKITNAKLDWWIEKAMADESGTFDAIDALPASSPGVEPVGHIVKVISEGEADRIAKMESPKARYEAYAANWCALYEDAHARDMRGEKPRVLNRYPAKALGPSLPQNTNTLSATITTAFLLDGAVTILQNRWAPLQAFTRDFSSDPYKPLASHVAKYVDATTAASTTATDFQVGGDTIDPVSITMAHYFKSFSVTQVQLNSGLRMQDLLTINMAGIADAIIKAATAPITAANFGTLAGTTGSIAPIVSSSAAFGWSELQTLWGGLKKSPIKNVIMDGAYLARIINNPTWYQTAGVRPGGGWSGFGWDFIGENTAWSSSAVSNLVAFACNPQAILCVAGLPITPPEGIPGNTLQIATATVPFVGITIANYSWFSLQSRTAWQSFDCMFGAAVADTTAGCYVTSS